MSVTPETPSRRDLAALQSQAEADGRPSLAQAFHRLGLMTEVWECLAAESPEEADAITGFIESAFSRVTQPDAETEEVSAWLLRESGSRWGDYLRLIDPDAAEEPDWADAPSDDFEDEPAAIDTGALFRMLTGNAPPTESVAPIVVAPAAEDIPLRLPVRVEKASPFKVPSPPTTLSIDPQLRDIFLEEASDLFERIETLVLGLGRGQGQSESLHELGRCFHTLKGAAGSVGLDELAALVHAMEEQLEGKAGKATDDLIESLHKLLHYLEGVFTAVKRGGQSSPPPMVAERPIVSKKVDEAPRIEAIAVEPVEPSPLPTQPAEGSMAEGPVRVSGERIDELMDLASELIMRRGLWASQAETMKEFASMARTCRNRMASTIDRLRDLRPKSEPNSTPPAGLDRHADLPELIRRLGEQADDLVVLTEAVQASVKPLADNSDALAGLTLQLWESLQAMRIVPVRSLFQRLARVAHDAARVEGRQVEVTTAGEETGLDRAVQDKAFEPLLHVVRNAVCHGIEQPGDRVSAGKSPTGRVTLGAARSGNSLVLTVEDDGRGLDYEAIAAKGRRLGLIGAAEDPTVERLNALVFQSGFSTREQANAIAGRGVGMDVVSQEVSRLHGSVVLTSRKGQGTRLSVSLPTRLSLQQVMVMRVDDQAFALPIDLIELAQSFDPNVVDRSGKHPTVLIREQSVPFVSAREALGMSPADAVSCPKLLLIRADGGPLAVQVDAIAGICELVVKPLSSLLSGHPIVSGTALSVTGEVIFALNPSGLARRVGNHQQPIASMARLAAPILVVDDSISVRKVVARHLRALGHEVEEVSDGLEALGRLKTQTYSLVFSDLEMPRMDGFELLAELSRLKITPAVPVVLTSTRSDPETQRRLLMLGAREFMAKPIDPDLMAAKVREWLPNRQAAQMSLSGAGEFDEMSHRGAL